MPEALALTRRALLAAGAAGLVATSTGTGSAALLPSVPRVDHLSIQVVIDSATFGPFLDNLTLPGLTVTRAGNGGQGGGPAPRMLPRALLGEFGLSLLATSTRAAQQRKVMVDFGYSKEAMANNLALLGIDPARIDAAVLSHGHLDHYGGFPGLFGAAPKHRRHLPLTVGGEETFCERVAMIGNPPLLMGTLDRPALSRAGFDVRIQPEPAIIADHAFTTGVIPLVGFERAAIPTAMRPGVGCDRALLDPAKLGLKQLPDDGEHELATCYAVDGLGLVVIASCSHRGVINSVRRAQAVSGIDKVHAVIGGFHLRPPAHSRRSPPHRRRIRPHRPNLDHPDALHRGCVHRRSDAGHAAEGGEVLCGIDVHVCGGVGASRLLKAHSNEAATL